MADENKPYGRYTDLVLGGVFLEGSSPLATVVAPDHTPPSDTRVQRPVPEDFDPYAIWNWNSPAAK